MYARTRGYVLPAKTPVPAPSLTNPVRPFAPDSAGGSGSGVKGARQRQASGHDFGRVAVTSLPIQAKNGSKKKKRAIAYRERLEQRLRDQAMGREERELAEISGQELPQVLPPLREAARDVSSTGVASREDSSAGEEEQDVDPLDAEEIAKRQRKIGAFTGRGVKRIPRSLRKEFRRAAKRDDASYRISGTGLALSTEGQVGPFDQQYPGGRVFWRGDTRSPTEVLKTGFTPKVERDLGESASPNTIIYRTGDEDIVPASGVCVATTPAGACFFPFDATEKPNENQEEHAFLYASVLSSATSTFGAQKASERAETGEKDWRRPSRFGYDPEERASYEGSAVWPGKEYVTHRINPEQIVGAWRFGRKRLVSPEETGDAVKAGMKFHILPKNLVRQSQVAEEHSEHRRRARAMAEAFRDEYPRKPGHYLSYQGEVSLQGPQPSSLSEAAKSARQVDPFPALPKGARKMVRPGNPGHFEKQQLLAERKERKQKMKRGKTARFEGRKKYGRGRQRGR